MTEYYYWNEKVIIVTNLGSQTYVVTRTTKIVTMITQEVTRTT